MKKYRIELVLGVVFLAVLLAYCNFVSTPKLTSAEVDDWCKENNHVRLNRDRQIGNYTAEAVVVPRMVYEHRADLQ